MLASSNLLGRGFTSDVYAWGEDRVLKLFHAGRPGANIEREYRAARAVHAAGLPAPAAYELLEIDGRLGIVFERVRGVSLFNQVQAAPWQLFSCVNRFAELHTQIHEVKAPASLPSQREWLASEIDLAAGICEAEKVAARRRLHELPDGEALCHGDFHPDNVFITARGPMIIDWDTATRGHPLGDVACTAHLIQSAKLPSWAARHAQVLLWCTRSLVLRTYLKRYLAMRPAPAAAADLDAWREVVSATSVP